MNKVGFRSWTTFILVGLVGQFAWSIENMYFNVFLYNTISTDPAYIAAMVAASAVTATLTTLFMGALSDRIGRRKALISGGYILWGLSTMAFGFITRDSFPTVAAAALGVVIADCVMTFFGSTANDAAFNAYITDNTNQGNRGKVESVLAVLPLISMLVIFGLFDSWTQAGEWKKFFLVFGGLVTLTGVVSLFLIKDAQLVPQKQPYFSNLICGFMPRTVKSLPRLYSALAAFMLFSIGVQVFFPYLIVYFQRYLKMDNYAIVLGIVLLFASVVSVLMGKPMDKLGKLRVASGAGAVMIIGLVALYNSKAFWPVVVSGCVMMAGYMCVTAALSAVIRDNTPEGKAGHFQGVRMVFAVMLPMVIGPFIGTAVINGSGGTYTELGQVKSVPTPEIFLASAVMVMLAVVVVMLMLRSDRKSNKKVKRSKSR